MFDLGGEQEDTNELEKLKYNYTTLKEYTDKELLSMEKEMLGLYISGHPLEEFRKEIEEYTNINTMQIQEGLDEYAETNKLPYKDGQAVKYAGIINSIKKKFTKNNKIMAFITIEDLYGSIETIAFENCYQASGTSLMEDNIVMVEGRLSIREDEGNVTIIANKIEDFSKAVKENTVAIPARKELYLNITNLNEEQKDKLRGAIKFFTGDRNNCGVKIVNGENVAPAGGIFVNEQILEEFRQIVGNENIEIK